MKRMYFLVIVIVLSLLAKVSIDTMLVPDIQTTVIKDNTHDTPAVSMNARPDIDTLLLDITALSYLVSLCEYNDMNERIMTMLVYIAETESQNSPKALLIIARVSSALKSMKDTSGLSADVQIKEMLCNDANRATVGTMLHEIEGHVKWYSDYVL